MNTLLLLVSCSLLGSVVASYGSSEGSAYTYHGMYPGKCSYDGLYYHDEKSFVYCSNGNSYVQNCAPGSRNSGYGKFAYGHSYSHRDFCDVNLVDSGYTVPKHEEPSYEEPKHEEPTYEAPNHEEPTYEAPKHEEPTYEAPKHEVPTYEAPKHEEPKYEDYAYTYHGRYPGKCQYDGLYFKDEYSFVYCSNGNSYVQPCAPGSKNSGYDNYSYGGKYDYRDFCDVNLVDGGYGYEYAKPSYKAHSNEETKYEEPSYGYTYHGMYANKCEYDGLYYKDAESFVFCVNGNSYVQPCAPGSRNSGYGKFSYGNTYSERDFCDVNLVDEGYAANKAAYH